MKKIVFILCMSLAVTMCASPCMAKQKKVTYKYKASNKTLTVSGKYLKGKGPIGIFDAYYMPTKYEYKWSSLSGKVKKVVLKKGVERIGYNAFGDFGKLKSVKFPKTLKRIDDYAFCATPIPNVSLPDRVKYIGKSAFDMDVIQEANKFGIDQAVRYACDEEGTALNYSVLSENIVKMRTTVGNAKESLPNDWSHKIRED